MGANWLTCFSLFMAITRRAAEALILSCRKSWANTERICSNWRETSRPRFSPPSVSTEKWGDFTSTHCSCAHAEAGLKQAITKAKNAQIGNFMKDQCSAKEQYLVISI